MPEDNNTKRIAKNTMMLYVRLFVSMLIGFYSSRIILKALGEVDYGIYSLVGGIVVLFSFLNSALTTATQRFLTIELGKGNYDGFENIFKISVTTHAIIAIAIFILSEIVGIYAINCILNIPEQRLFSANIVLQFSILTFMVQMVQVPFNSTVIAHEQMSYYAWLSIIEICLKLIVALSLLYILNDKLICYAVFLFFTSLVILSSYIIVCYKRFQLKYSFFWNKKLFIKLVSFSSWRLLGGGSRILEQQGFNFALNIFSGIVANASIGIANQVSSLANNFVANFQLAFNPQITKLYAIGKYEDMFTLSFRSAKYSFFLLFLVCTPLLSNIDYFLELWLEKPPSMTSSFCVVILCNMLIEAISAPLWMIIISTGNIAKYQFLMSVYILIGLVFTILLLFMGVAPEIALCCRIGVTIAILIMRLRLSKGMLNYPIKGFIRNVICPMIYVSIPTVLIIVIVWPYLLGPRIVNSMIAFLIALSLVWLLGIGRNEKDYIIKIVVNRMKK